MLPSLPTALGDAFSVADARRAGVGRSRLAGDDLRSPFWGVRAAPPPVGERAEDSVRRRAHAYASRMRPDEHFCLIAAAVLWGAPLPAYAFVEVDRYGRRTERRLDVGVILPARAPRGRGVLGRSALPALCSVRDESSTGLRVTSPASTWAMLGELLTIEDLVVIGDHMVREPMRDGDPVALCTVEELDAALGAGRRRGRAKLRAAFDLIRARSRSRQETRLRLAIIEAELPEPELNWPLIQDGRVVALIDLAYRNSKVAIEYEGEQHLIDPEQWARDIRRYEMLAQLGWHVIRVTKSDLGKGRVELIARIRAALV